MADDDAIQRRMFAYVLTVILPPGPPFTNMV